MTFFDFRTDLKYVSIFSFNWISGYEINCVLNIIIFALGSRTELTFLFDWNNLFKSRSNVKIYLASKDIKKFTSLNRLKILKVFCRSFSLPNKSSNLSIRLPNQLSVLLLSALLRRLSTLLASLTDFLLYNNVSSYVLMRHQAYVLTSPQNIYMC